MTLAWTLWMKAKAKQSDSPPLFMPICCSSMTARGEGRPRQGLNTTGTLGVLDLAARRGLLDLTEAFARRRQTNFHCPEKLMQRLLDEHTGRGTP